MNGMFGIAGTDHRMRVEQAMFGIAGEIRARTYEGMQFAGENFGRGVGIAEGLRRRDTRLAELIARQSRRPGEEAVRKAWRRVCFFADFTYLVSPLAFAAEGASTAQSVFWRTDRDGLPIVETIFGRKNRALPVYLDSCGYRREISKTAPGWAHTFDYYPAAIELIGPDGYAAYDFPQDRKKTLDHLRRLEIYFPHDPRCWPVFSVLWVWQRSPHLDFGRLPGWASQDLSWFIPLTRTQRYYKPGTLERYARLAVANALLLGSDPDFKALVDKYGKVMIGGLIASDCPRIARHLYGGVLARMYPGVPFWLLGQASAPVLNGLGMLELLDATWTDSTAWILDSTLDRWLVMENGLLITLNDTQDPHRKMHPFFTRAEMMAAGIRGRAAVYEGLFDRPAPEWRQLNLADRADRAVGKDYLRKSYLEVAEQTRMKLKAG